jgi:hypothetical protein
MGRQRERLGEYDERLYDISEKGLFFDFLAFSPAP